MDSVPSEIKYTSNYKNILVDKDNNLVKPVHLDHKVTLPMNSEAGIHLLSSIPIEHTHRIADIERLMNYCSHTTKGCQNKSVIHALMRGASDPEFYPSLVKYLEEESREEERGLFSEVKEIF